MDKKQVDDYRRINGYFKSSIKCKVCGHTILPTTERILCTHYGYWNYRNNKVEFRYKVLEKIRRNKNGNKFNGK
jgi:hypothetical protein